MPKLDRIEEAAKLITGGHVQPFRSGRFLVTSSKWARTATVYDFSFDERCPCYDSRSHICKHQWAALAPAVVFLILKIRKAADELELEASVFPVNDLLGGVEDRFVRFARQEYAARLLALRGVSNDPSL